VQQVEREVEEEGEGHSEARIAETMPHRRLEKGIERETDDHAG